MPLYEYECESGHRFEKIRKFSDPPLTECPTCGRPVHKLMSSPAIQFKGSGWYITDYARKDSTAAGKVEKTDKGDSTDKGESKSEKIEAKPDAKGDSKSGKTDTPASKS